MKKILLATRPLCPPWDEASKNFAYQLACHISTHEMTILTSGLLPNLPSNVVQKSIYTTCSFSYLQKMRFVQQMRRLRKNNYDILHYLFTPTKLNSFLLKNFTHHKEKKTIQTIATLRGDLFSDSELKKMLFADTLVTYSQFSKDKLLSLGFDNVQHIYPGIDLTNFVPEDKSSKLLQEFLLKKEDFIVVYAGEYTRLGGTDMIVKALLDLWKHKEYSDYIKFIFALRIKNKEDIIKKKEVQETFKKYGFSDNVRFIETFSNMNTLYNLSDIVVFPVAHMYGKFDIPLAAVEPYACKKPVIITNLPGFKEFTNPDISVTIPVDNSQAFAEAIVQLYLNTARTKQMGENARAYVKDKFDIIKSALAYNKLYNKL